MPYRLLVLLVGIVFFAPCAYASCNNAEKALVTGDYKQAVNYYRQCSAKGDAESTYKLATLCAKGLGISAPDKDMAARYYRKAAKVGYAPAQIMVAVGLLSIKNPSSDDRIQGYKWLLLASEKSENKWMYPIKDTAYSPKVIEYLTKFSARVSDADKKQAIADATAFKQNAVFLMAKTVLDKDGYKNFMVEYRKGGEARVNALAMLKTYSAKYQK